MDAPLVCTMVATLEAWAISIYAAMEVIASSSYGSGNATMFLQGVLYSTYGPSKCMKETDKSNKISMAKVFLKFDIIEMQLDKNECHTTTENNSEILESNSAAPAKNANFPMNS